MEILIARVAATAGANPDVARKAVALMLDFIVAKRLRARSTRCSPRRRP